MIDKFNTLLIGDNNHITVKTLSIYMYIFKANTSHTKNDNI